MILQVQFFLTVCTDNLNIKDDDFGHRLFCVLLAIYGYRTKPTRFVAYRTKSVCENPYNTRYLLVL